MDNLTHTLVGLMLARCGLDRVGPRATGMMMIAANAPDFDLVSWYGGTVTFLDQHRGYTHALAATPILALIPIVLVRAKLGWKTYLASVVGVLSHMLLDWTNVYGIRLLLPFSSRWLRLDMTDVVDPWILLGLLLALAAPGLSRLVTGEIGGKSPGPQRAWAWGAILALLCYEGARFTLHDRAIAVMSSHLYNGEPARSIHAAPNRWSPLQWRGIIEGDGSVTIVPVDIRHQFDPTAGRTEYSALMGPAIDAARSTREFQVMQRFSQLPFWKATPLADATRVELIDLRFGTPRSPGLEAEAQVDPSGRVLESRLGFDPPR